MVCVTVITPFYKGNEYLPVLYDSILANQKYGQKKDKKFEIEWIIVNDSPDIEIHNIFTHEELKVKVIHHSANSGIHQARITGLYQASGEYILFLDQDDTISKECIFDAYTAIDDYDLLIENAWIENEYGDKHLLYRTKGAIINLMNYKTYLYAYNQIVSPGHCLMKKSAIPAAWKKNILTLNGSDDLYLWLLMFGENAKIHYLNNAYYTHQNTGKNLSSSVERMSQSSLLIAQYLKNEGTFSDAQIRRFIRSRKMSIAMSKANSFYKMIILLMNFDIASLRFFWKMRKILLK